MSFATSIHLVRGSVSLLLAVMLLTLRAGFSEDRHYRIVGRCLVATALVNVMIDVLSAIAEIYECNISGSVDSTLVPAAYIVQIIIMTYALVLMSRAGQSVSKRHFFLFYVAFCLLTGSCLLLHNNGGLWAFFHIIRTVSLAGCVITFLNRKPQDIIAPSGPAQEGLPIQEQPRQQQSSPVTGTLAAIQEWEARPDKPYLKEGLTISDVAGQLGTSSTQVSFVLNHSMGLNFNTWINRLRIGEAKRLIEADPDTQISDIAFKSGFSDIAVFSRNFKKIEGLTATDYKRKQALKSPESDLAK